MTYMRKMVAENEVPIRVLILDEEFPDIVRTIMESVGLTVRVFSGRSLQDLEFAFSQFPANVVLLATRFRRFQGLDSLQTLKKLCPGIPCGVLTPEGRDMDEPEMQPFTGANAYLNKPLNIHHLLMEVDRLAGKKNAVHARSFAG